MSTIEASALAGRPGHQEGGARAGGGGQGAGQPAAARAAHAPPPADRRLTFRAAFVLEAADATEGQRKSSRVTFNLLTEGEQAGAAAKALGKQAHALTLEGIRTSALVGAAGQTPIKAVIHYDGEGVLADAFNSEMTARALEAGAAVEISANKWGSLYGTATAVAPLLMLDDPKHPISISLYPDPESAAFVLQPPHTRVAATVTVEFVVAGAVGTLLARTEVFPAFVRELQPLGLKAHYIQVNSFNKPLYGNSRFVGTESS